MTPEPRAVRRLVFEIGTEELPPADASQGAAQLEAAARAAFEAARISTRRVRALSTPRRLALIVDGVAAAQSDAVREVRGPAVRAAFTPDGQPTPAAAGFARAQGVDPSALERRTTAQGEYVYAVRRELGAATETVLLELLPRLAAGLVFPKPMRWGRGTVEFSRPVRWMVAVFGSDVLPCEFAGLRAGNMSRGHRSLRPRPVAVRSARGYERALQAGFVLLDPGERRQRIVEGARAAAAAAGGRAVLDPDLLEETVQLVEWPTVFAGRFEAEFLDLPREVLITVMQHHQKYFAVEDARGGLRPAFLAVRNGDDRALDVVREGNEWVLRARLADARFFFDEDRGRPLADRVAALSDLVFLDRLGTMAQKTARLEGLAGRLGPHVGAEGAARAALERAAHLSKADLVTQMVRELPELQGIMGGIYAQLDDEIDGVAEAIREQYLPRGAQMPGTDGGARLAVLDKLDTLVGALSIGIAPSGSQDPYGLRRAANGIVAIALDRGVRTSMALLCRAAVEQYGIDGERQEPLVGEAVGVLRQRLRTLLIEQGTGYDAVDAALEADARAWTVDPHDYVAAAGRARALQAFRTDPAFGRLHAAFDRALRIVPKDTPLDEAANVQRGLIRAPAEHALYDAVEQAGRTIADIWRDAAGDGSADALRERYLASLHALAAQLAGPIDRFFSDLLVMDPDADVRRNRLAQLIGVVRLVRGAGDLSRVVVAGGSGAVAR